MALTHGDDASIIEAISVLDTLGATPVANRYRAELRDRTFRRPEGANP